VSLRWLFGALALCACQSEPDRVVRVAAASNVADTVTAIGSELREQRGLLIEVSAGSSGKLATQIANGAPFQVFLSADAARPARLEASGHAVAGTSFTYAIGRLALCGRGLSEPSQARQKLAEGSFQHFAIANPETAPYGTAAVQVLERLGAWARTKDRTVRGENVAQTLQFVESGSAELGLLALSTVIGRTALSCWQVPANLHEPIRQDALLLGPGRDRPEARAFLDALKGPEARRSFEAAGYDVPR
jgi:molybdate transport system substrate-binding protein